MPSKRVLVWVRLDSHFRELLRVARLLAARTSYQPFFVFEGWYPRLAEDMGQCQTEHFPCYHLDAKAVVAKSTGEPNAIDHSCPATAPKSSALRRIYRRAIAWPVIKHVVPRMMAGVRSAIGSAVILVQYANAGRRARRLLKEHDPAVLIFPEDNVEYGTAFFIKAGHARGIPSIVILYTLANAQEAAEAYFDSFPNQVRGLANRLAAWWYPHWAYEHRGRRLLRMPAILVLAQEWFGLAPPRPWVLNSGYADAIVLESEAVRDYYLRAALPASQLRVLGSLRQDEMSRHRRQAVENRRTLLQSLRLEDDRPVVLCALPPDQNPAERPGCEFRRYADLVRSWGEILGSLPDCHVLVNPHPRTILHEVTALKSCRVHVVTEDIARLIPLCDLYVASVSATICMALACDKPVVNYDVYRYDYDDFDGVPEVTTVDNRTSFADALRSALKRVQAQGPLTPKQSPAAEHWGRLDGKASDRILDLIDDLAGRSSASPSQKIAIGSGQTAGVTKKCA